MMDNYRFEHKTAPSADTPGTAIGATNSVGLLPSNHTKERRKNQLWQEKVLETPRGVGQSGKRL